MSKCNVRKGCPKQFDIVFSYAEENGWEVNRTGGGHLRFKKVDRQPVHSSSTPSCQFAHKKILAELMRKDKQAAV